MDSELKRLLRQIQDKGALVNGAPTSETFDNTDDSLEQISDNVGQPQDRANFQSLEAMLGLPDAADSNLDDMLRTGFDSSAVTANEDGSVMERLESLLLSGSLDELVLLADYDDFDVADADADTERWNIGYINGGAGGSADINTTTADQLHVEVDPSGGPAAAGYAVNLAQPIVSKYFSVMADLDVNSFGTPNTSWASLGIRVSSLSYDSNRVVYAQRQASSGGVGNRITVGANFNAGATEYNFTSSDTTLSFRIDRADNVWRCYYSLTQSPDYAWTLLGQFEDSAEEMDSQQSVFIDAYTPGNGVGQLASGDFDNFRLYENLKGLSQQLSGDYDSSAVAADEDGSLAERLEQVQEAVNRGTGSSLPADKSLVDIIGTSYLDAGGAFQADSVSDDLRTLARYIADGTEGSEAGSALPAGKSIVDVVGTAYVDGAGGWNTENLADDLNRLGQYIMDGAAGAEAGTVLPAGKSLYDVIGTSYVDAGGGLGTDSIASDLGIIEGLVDSAEVAGPYSYLDAGAEQDIYEDTAVTRRKIWLEVSNRNMTQSGTFRVYRKVDGSSYDLYSSDAIVASGVRVLDYEFTTNQQWKVTYEEDVDEAAARDIPFNVIVQVIE